MHPIYVLNSSWATLNGRALTARGIHTISSFVEQEDALLGVLTVRESISFALRLHLPLLPAKDVRERVDRVIVAMGLAGCADQIIGTPVQRGISGGQKRRVTAACSMVTFPRILFLDEVTSGLDSTSAREVMAAIRVLAQAEGIAVIASIHQPSLETLTQFTDVMLLADGRVCYLGRVAEMESFFDQWGRPVSRFRTPSDHAMNFLNSDFAHPEDSARTIAEFRDFYVLSWAPKHGRALVSAEKTSTLTSSVSDEADTKRFGGTTSKVDAHVYGAARSKLQKTFWNTLVLAQRTTLNYRRNLLAYGVRGGMYAGMGLMLATIWIRLGDSDSTINDRLSVHFYSVAFLAFMSVAGIPSFLEERAAYYRETKNGLYTTLPFVLSNTLVNIPFLLACTIVFTLICYWAIGLHSGAAPFFRFVAFLFLAIFTAETQALLVASLLPIFVAALAIAAFLNGFWMSVGGYFIKARSLPRFWFFSFHYMDYQKYAFELLTNSDLGGLTFQLSGTDVLNYLDIDGISYGNWTGILVSILVIYRICLYYALRLRSQ
ncbi:hypothetical protein D9619_012478 [Psilocybe cf. subviscida]|uniref:ABC transporter domain-containing protein n=1 Tax=Psilocybe cf. subviscida TaxID=2480587 RepID=A0A8H5ART6_9AGAR|nr:hypothetical protein D9619_012478 [Psilocybe cf. subviscida]